LAALQYNISFLLGVSENVADYISLAGKRAMFLVEFDAVVQ
jgi:hypothetical protein